MRNHLPSDWLINPGWQNGAVGDSDWPGAPSRPLSPTLTHSHLPPSPPRPSAHTRHGRRSPSKILNILHPKLFFSLPFSFPPSLVDYTARSPVTLCESPLRFFFIDFFLLSNFFPLRSCPSIFIVCSRCGYFAFRWEREKIFFLSGGGGIWRR